MSYHQDFIVGLLQQALSELYQRAPPNQLDADELPFPLEFLTIEPRQLPTSELMGLIVDLNYLYHINTSNSTRVTSAATPEPPTKRRRTEY